MKLIYLLSLTILLSAAANLSMAAEESLTIPPANSKNVKSEGLVNTEKMEYTFNGEGVLYIRLYNEDHRIIQINSVINKGEMTYKFKKAGIYYMQFNYENGDRWTKKLVMSQGSPVYVTK